MLRSVDSARVLSILAADRGDPARLADLETSVPSRYAAQSVDGIGLLRGFGLCLCLSGCSAGVEGAATFTFSPPDVEVGDTTGEGPEDDSTDPSAGSGGVSDSASPTTGLEETTGDESTTLPDPTTDSDAPSTTGAPGECDPGETRSCYTGPDGTADVGACSSGTEACGDDTMWTGTCDGEVLPGAENCDGEDNDCDGASDNDNPDGGDACNTGLAGPCQPGVLTCVNGALVCDGDVNPAASETCGNNIDDDCSGAVDDGCSCDPGNPGLDCAAGESCTPSVSGDTSCAGPVGLGGQYTTCVDNTACAPGYTLRRHRGRHRLLHGVVHVLPRLPGGTRRLRVAQPHGVRRPSRVGRLLRRPGLTDSSFRPALNIPPAARNHEKRACPQGTRSFLWVEEDRRV